jgi:hypothetical protein
MTTQTRYAYKNESRSSAWYILYFKPSKDRWQVMIYSDSRYLDHDKTLVTDDETKAQAYFDEYTRKFQKMGTWYSNYELLAN